jgi:hypothetical protein
VEFIAPGYVRRSVPVSLPTECSGIRTPFLRMPRGRGSTGRATSHGFWVSWLVCPVIFRGRPLRGFAQIIRRCCFHSELDSSCMWFLHGWAFVLP